MQTTAPAPLPVSEQVAALVGDTNPLHQSRGDLGEAFARRLGIPVLKRDHENEDTPIPIGRRARRATGQRGPLHPLARSIHPHPTFRKEKTK